MDQICIHALLTCEAAYCAATGHARATVGKKAAGDWRFFDSLEGNRPARFSANKFGAIMDWFAGHWPEGCDSPDCLADHIALRQWEAANSYSCALASGDPVPRVMVPPICRSVGPGAAGLSGLTVEPAEGV